MADLTFERLMTQVVHLLRVRVGRSDYFVGFLERLHSVCTESVSIDSTEDVVDLFRWVLYRLDLPTEDAAALHERVVSTVTVENPQTLVDALVAMAWVLSGKARHPVTQQPVLSFPIICALLEEILCVIVELNAEVERAIASLHFEKPAEPNTFRFTIDVAAEESTSHAKIAEDLQHRLEALSVDHYRKIVEHFAGASAVDIKVFLAFLENLEAEMKLTAPVSNPKKSLLN